MNSLWNFMVEFDLESMGAGLLILMMLIGLIFSAGAGILLRYCLKRTRFVKSAMHLQRQRTLLILTLVVLVASAAMQLYLLALLSYFLLVSIFAYSIWDANPTWNED